MTTLVTSAPILAKLIDNSVFVFKIFTEHTEFNMQGSLLVHFFTRSMPRTVGQTSNVSWAESRPGAQMGWTCHAVTCADRDLFLELIAEHSAHTAAFFFEISLSMWRKKEQDKL